jgi:RNA polymerase sigma-70 factor (ECF subfamily)
MIQESEYNELLQRAIGQLPLQQRTVYVLAKEEGISHEEIAERLQLSKNTIQTHLKLATRSIRKYVAQRLFDYIPVTITFYALLHKA